MYECIYIFHVQNLQIHKIKILISLPLILSCPHFLSHSIKKKTFLIYTIYSRYVFHGSVTSVGCLVDRLVGHNFQEGHAICQLLLHHTLPIYKTAFRIHLILMWIRIRILGSTFGKSGSGSGSSDPPFHNSGSGSGSSDPHLEKVDPDPDLDPSTLNIFRL